MKRLSASWSGCKKSQALASSLNLLKLWGTQDDDWLCICEMKPIVILGIRLPFRTCKNILFRLRNGFSGVTVEDKEVHAGVHPRFTSIAAEELEEYGRMVKATSVHLVEI